MEGPEFQVLLAAEGGDLPRFYARVKELAAQPKAQREAALGALISRSAGVAGQASQQ